MNILIIILIVFLHWLLDFVCQTDWMAKNKSKNNNALIAHTLIYTLIYTLGWLPFSIILFGGNGWIFLLVTYICHTFTDYWTSRLNTYLWNKGDVHNFFVSVGFDQFLHYLQLYLTVYLLL